MAVGAVALLLIVLPIVLLLASGRTPTIAATSDVVPGSRLVITGSGFEPGSTVSFSLNGAGQEWLPAVTADENGGFTVVVLVPETVEPGTHELAAISEDVEEPVTAVVQAYQGDLALEPTVPTQTPSPTPEPTDTPTPDPTASPTPDPTAPPAVAADPTAVPGTPRGSGGTAAVGPYVGYGAGTTGGAGGTVIAVTNLNDSGSGSLRAALEASGARVVTFDVAGLISLSSDLDVKNPNLTIAGETAPGAGIVIRGGSLKITASNVVVRHLRLRPGDQTSNPADTDALTLNGVKSPVTKVVVDHVSMVWGPDIGGLAILGDVRDVTISNSIMGEGLFLSRHPEGTSGEDGHSHAVNISQLKSSSPAPERLTFWRNLLTTSDTRIPRLQGAACVDFVNNVIYNWGKHSAHGNPRSVNLVNNWYRSGPETESNEVWSPQTSQVASKLFSGSVYEAGTVADGFSAARGGDASLYAGGVLCGGLSVGASASGDVLDIVVANVGATAPIRDPVDARIVGNVLARTGSFFNGVGNPGPNPGY